MTDKMSRSWDWKPKFRWFAAEFLVVVSGVLVALALGAIYERRADQRNEAVYLSLLERDLRTTLADLETESAFQAARSNNRVIELHRIVIFGNSGSGKTTMARRLAAEYQVAHLDLNHLAWTSPGIRKPLADSAAEIHAFANLTPEWVAESCYADLVELLLPYATEIRFLNPGVEVCVENALRRPWEPAKYASEEDQDARLGFLIDWIRDYEIRTDEYSLVHHLRLFNDFRGPKREFSEPAG